MRRNPRFTERFPVDAAQSPRRRREAPPADRLPPEPVPVWARARIGRERIIAIVLAAIVLAGGIGWWALGNGAGRQPHEVRPLPLPGLAEASAPAAPQPPLAGDPAALDASGAPLVDPSLTDANGAPLPAPGLAQVLPIEGDAVTAAMPQADAGPATIPSPRRTASPVLVFDAGDARAASDGPSGGAAGETQLVIAPTPIPAAGKVAPATGRFSSGGGRSVVTRGTLIPAVLESTIDSGTPGGVRAVVTADVRSSDGARVLIPKSARLVGQYRGGDGGRAYVIWTRVDQPGGRAVKVGSAPGGAGAKTDGAFLASFGAARLQSVVSGAGGAGVRVRQGEPIRVYAASDLDLGGNVGGKGK